MKKQKGASLVQYAIMLSLLSVGVIGVYYALGSQINNILNSYLDIFTSNNVKINANKQLLSSAYSGPVKVTNVVQGGSLGGTVNTPVKICSNNMCNIDYGEFVLSGIPSDYGEFVKTNGNSGGTETLATLIEQIAQHLEDEGDLPGAQEFREMANLGHYLASLSKELEDKAKEANATSDPLASFKSKIFEVSSAPMPQNVANLVPDLNNYDTDLFKVSYSNFYHAYQIKHTSENGMPGHPLPSSSNSIGYKMLDYLDNIKANNKYTPEMKNITQELYDQIAKLNANMDEAIWLTRLTQQFGVSVTVATDLNGGTKEVIVNSLDDILHPKTSFGTHLDSALICVTGHNTDPGTVCN